MEEEKEKDVKRIKVEEIIDYEEERLCLRFRKSFLLQLEAVIFCKEEVGGYRCICIISIAKQNGTGDNFRKLIS